jgi:hypothetical protein
MKITSRFLLSRFEKDFRQVHAVHRHSHTQLEPVFTVA